MNIRETKNHLTVHRYGGSANGKSLEVRICTLPADTSPYAIPAGIIEQLTPLELNKLQAKLHEIQTKIMRARAASIVDGLHEITSALETDLLDHQSVVALHKAATMLVKRSRPIVTNPSTTNVPVKST